MTKSISKRITIVLVMAVLFIGFGLAAPVHAASDADMAKAKVKWDLKNNKKLKFKTRWCALGVKQHTVKMTGFKITDAGEGYKQCTFTLTFNRKVRASRKQVNKMQAYYEKNDTFGGSFYYTVVDYNTGRSLEGENDKDVTVSDSGWKYSKWKTLKGTGGKWVSYAKKARVKVKIVYPETYKDLAIGVGGYATVKGAPDAYWEGEKEFSKVKAFKYRKDKKYAHFKRVR